ncbi:hypothetical protein CDAR_616661 [Caerostris darwini]|uniref:Uncharacterized protein n=1 Tax=Caerostris darwini TaxID=1538125 RepID=A0AAV4VU82_9ARAC|nr:hypothetical protein CDAR_616661 [Caerostris darwini]
MSDLKKASEDKNAILIGIVHTQGGWQGSVIIEQDSLHRPIKRIFRMAGTSGPGGRPEVDAPPTPNNNWLTDADSFDILMHRSHPDKKAVFRKTSILDVFDSSIDKGAPNVH